MIEKRLFTNHPIFIGIDTTKNSFVIVTTNGFAGTFFVTNFAITIMRCKKRDAYVRAPPSSGEAKVVRLNKC